MTEYEAPAGSLITAVIPCEGGESSTPRPIDSITTASEYWIARLRGRWHRVCGCRHALSSSRL